MVYGRHPFSLSRAVGEGYHHQKATHPQAERRVSHHRTRRPLFCHRISHPKNFFYRNRKLQLCYSKTFFISKLLSKNNIIKTKQAFVGVKFPNSNLCFTAISQLSCCKGGCKNKFKFGLREIKTDLTHCHMRCICDSDYNTPSKRQSLVQRNQNPDANPYDGGNETFIVIA